MQQPTQINQYEKTVFTAPIRSGHSIQHDVYARGNGNKVVVIIQELPGIGQETLALADRFMARGYRVYLPHLFGPIGKTSTNMNLLRVFCMRRQFKIMAKHQSSPIVDWLKALCRDIKQQTGVKGVATIGMCLTGNFAISLMADESVLAGFASQPSLPVGTQEALHMSSQEIEQVKHRLDELPAMHCGRFEKDKLCQASKFELLDKTFNDQQKQRMIFHEIPGEGHAILTLDFVDDAQHPTHKALEEVMTYFDEQLS